MPSAEFRPWPCPTWRRRPSCPTSIPSASRRFPFLERCMQGFSLAGRKLFQERGNWGLCPPKWMIFRRNSERPLTPAPRPFFWKIHFFQKLMTKIMSKNNELYDDIWPNMTKYDQIIPNLWLKTYDQNFSFVSKKLTLKLSRSEMIPLPLRSFSENSSIFVSPRV